MSTLEKFHSIVSENDSFFDIPEYYYDCSSYKKVLEKCCSITQGILQLKGITCQKNETSFDFKMEINDGSYPISLNYINDFIDSVCLEKEMNRILKEVGYDGEKYFCDLSSGILEFGIAFINEKQEHELAVLYMVYRDGDWLASRNLTAVTSADAVEAQAVPQETETIKEVELVEIMETQGECFIKVNLPNDGSAKSRILSNLFEMIQDNLKKQVVKYHGKLTIVCFNHDLQVGEIEEYNKVLQSMPTKPKLKYGLLGLNSQEIYLTIAHSTEFFIDVEIINGKYEVFYKRKTDS